MGIGRIQVEGQAFRRLLGQPAGTVLHLYRRTGWHPRGFQQVLLVGIVLLGFALRIWHLDYDQSMSSHPDERSNSFYGVTIRMPSEVGDLLHPRASPLNPFWDQSQERERHFTYGHFPLYLGVLAATLVDHAAPLLQALGVPERWVQVAAEAQTNSYSFLFAGRFVIALLDTLTIWLLFLTARRLYGVHTALLASFLWAVAVMPFKDSHFFTVDIAITTFVTLTLLGFLVLLDHPGSFRGIGLTGLGIGLSVASKFSALPLVCLFAGLYFLAWRRHTATAVHAAPGRIVWALGWQFLVVVSIAIGTFIITSPFVLLDWEAFRFSVLEQQGGMVTGEYDWPFTRQYRGTVPYWYFIQQQLQWGLWYPLGLTALAGTLWTIMRLGTSFRTRAFSWLPRPLDGEWLIVLWILLYFVPTGAFLAKFNRYILPILPSVILLGTGLITWCGHRWQSQQAGNRHLSAHRQARTGRWSGTLWTWIVVAGSIFWLGANINGIYKGNHTWYDASRWMYQNAPDGSVFLWELWDDPLPKSWESLVRHDESLRASLPRKQFTTMDWSPFREEDEHKLEQLKSALLATDYVVFSSRRTYGVIPRLPQRYPLVVRYYELLFNGELGFEVVHRETRSPEALGLRFNDIRADESWRLYDHPPVTILAKVKPLTEAELDALLADTIAEADNWSLPSSPFPTSFLADIELTRYLDAVQSETDGQALDGVRSTLGRVLFGAPDFAELDYPLTSAQSLDRFRFNTLGSTRTWAAILMWWGGLALMGLVAWPFCFVLFARLPDSGYALTRSVGWLGLALITWWLAHTGLPAFTVTGVWSVVGIVLVAAAVMTWRLRHAMARQLRGRWRLLLWQEAGFTLAYLAFVGMRLLNPDLWHPWEGGEKFMDLAIVNGILHSPVLPPLDPHFAGRFLNYYYWGHYLVAFLIKLTGLWTEVAYNVALASLFALTVLLSWACVFYFHMRSPVVRPEQGLLVRFEALSWRPALRKALWAPLLVVGIGNLQGAHQLVRKANDHAPDILPTWPFLLREPARSITGLWELLRSGAVWQYDYWGPSRVIPNTINEFPYWTFLFGDLHAHLLVMPITLVLLCCIVFGYWYIQDQRQVVVLLALLAVLSSIGIATNLWELPLYVSLVFPFLLVLGHRHFPGAKALSGLFLPLFVLLALAALLPFWRQFEITGSSGLGWIQQGDVPTVWLRIWGLFYAVILTWLFSHLYVVLSGQPRAVRSGEIRRLVMLAVITVGPCLLWQRTTLALVVLPLMLCLFLLWRRRSMLSEAQVLVLWWLVLVLGIWASTQMVYIRDFLGGGDYYRMNTLFKFFLQAWVLAAVASAMLLPGLWHRLRSLPAPGWAWICGCGFGLLLAASLVYPLLGTPVRLLKRFPGEVPAIGTLNGLDYMHTGTYTWPDQNSEIILAYDRQAIDWLNASITRNLVILESDVVDYYRAGGTRIASHTGLPGLLGMHQSEQRPADLVGQRSGVMRSIWNAQSSDQMLQLLTDNSIDLVYAGQLEQVSHPQGVQQLAELHRNGHLELVYENPGTRIYALPDGRIPVHEATP